MTSVQDTGSLAVFKVTARDQGHYKGPSGGGAFVMYSNISCFFFCFFLPLSFYLYFVGNFAFQF